VARTRNLQVVISGDAKSLNRAFNEAGVSAGRAETKMSKFGGMLRTLGPAAGIASVGFIALGKSAVDAASDVNESLTKNQVLFGKYAQGVKAFSEQSAKSFGVSKAAALEYTGVFGNLFNALGVSQRKSADFSVSLTKLAADMASFNNTSIEDALEAIRSGLVGETEPLRRFGVNLNDATLRQEAMALGLTKTVKNVLTPYQRSMAAQALIVKQTSAAHGDFARTSNGLANQQRILSARVEDLKVKLGTALLPAALSATKALNNLGSSSRDINRFLERNRESINELTAAFRRIVATVGPIVGRMATEVIGHFTRMAKVFADVVGTITALINGDWAKAWRRARTAVKDSFGAMAGDIRAVGSAILDASTAIGKIIVKGILAGMGDLGHAILGKIKGAADFVGNQVSKLNPFGDGVGKALGDGAGKAINGQVAVPGGGLPSLMGAQPALAPVASLGARFGLHTSSGRRPGSITSSGNVSYHSTGEALDEAGSPGAMMNFFQYMKTRFGPRLAELIYTPGGVGIKNGQPFRYTGAVAADHYDHVHVAIDTGRAGVGDGPGKEGTGKFSQFAKGVWSKATGIMGSPGAMPNIVFSKLSADAYAHFNTVNGNVAISPEMLAAYRDPNNPDHDYALDSLVHEFAHARQRSDVIMGPIRSREGGAEAFSQWATGRIMSSLGIPYDKSKDPSGYPDEESWVKRNKGSKWWQYGQFSHPGTGDGLGMTAADAARKAGFSGSALVTALAVADAESQFRPGAQNLKYPDHSIGLWQINQLAHHGRYGSDSALKNPLTNARAAYAISGGGRNWQWWTTFTNGKYKKYLSVARSLAVGSRSGGSSTKMSGGSGSAGSSSAGRITVSGGSGYAPGYGSVGSEGMGTANPIGDVSFAGVESGYTAPTESDYLSAQSSQASLSRGLGDDLAAAQNNFSYGLRNYNNALAGGDPRAIAEAAQQLRSAADSLQAVTDQMKQEQVDWANADLALAQLTDTIDDDKAALEKKKALDEELLQEAKDANDPRKIAEAANNLKADTDALKSLTASIDEQNKNTQELIDLNKQVVDNQNRIINLTTQQGPQLMAAFAAAISGGIGGKVGLGFQSVGYAGSGVRY
jgi:hypothetical protein